MPAAGAAYWGVALILLVLSLARASVVGGTPLIRQRARILCAAFVLGYVPPILGTAAEALFQVTVPYLNAMWKLTLLFPIVMAYAMVRYDLFDVRAALRAGAVYSAATGLVVLAYTGAIAGTDILLANWEAAQSPIVAAAVMAVLVVVLLNPLYLRSQRLVDRLFFRQRVDVQRSIEHVSEVMSGLLDLRRIVELLTQTVEEQLHPVRQELYLLDARRQGYVRADQEEADEQDGRPPIDGGSPLVRCLELRRQPLTRERVEEDPALEDYRAGCLAAMDGLGATLAVPFLFQGRVTGFLALGPKRSGLGYSSQDLGLLRLLANSSALALEHARAYAALQDTNAELRAAVRRVEILESIRTNLAKFVPRTVQDLIERAPEAPELDKREVDVTVLFVDLVGYTRLTERLDPGRVNELVERCFGAYLDEILRRGGDVNETAGDGLMAIFRDADSRRHARQAVRCALGILRRTRELNETLARAARAARRPHRRELRPRHRGRHQDRGRERHAMDVHGVGAGHHRGGPSRRPRPEGRDPGGSRHQGAAGRRVLVRGPRRAALAERRDAGEGVPADAGPARSRDGHGLSGRGAPAPTRADPGPSGRSRPHPRPIDQNSAPKWSHGRRHSSVRSRSAVKNWLTA